MLRRCMGQTVPKRPFQMMITRTFDRSPSVACVEMTAPSSSSWKPFNINAAKHFFTGTPRRTPIPSSPFAPIGRRAPSWTPFYEHHGEPRMSSSSSCRSPFVSFNFATPSRSTKTPLSTSTPASEHHDISFSASSTPATSYTFRCMSSGELGAPRRILVVVDATKELRTESLEWTLAHVAQPGDFVTFLGILPWLTIPLGVKRWAELSTIIDEESCKTRSGEGQLKSSEFQRIQQEYHDKGVFLNIRIASGYPPKTVAVRMAKKLQAKWIIFYRCMNKRADHFLTTVGGNIVFLKNSNEGSISFASKPTIFSPIMLGREPGFEPDINTHPNVRDLEVKWNVQPDHVTLGECLGRQI